MTDTSQTNVFPGGEPSTENEQIVVDFIHSFGPGTYAEFRAGFEKWMTDDVSWENTGSPAKVGKAAAIEFLDHMHEKLGLAYCTVDIHNIASRGDVVLTERTDRMHLSDGSVAVSVPIMGSFTVRDGKIARYADYSADSPVRAVFPQLAGR